MGPTIAISDDEAVVQPNTRPRRTNKPSGRIIDKDNVANLELWSHRQIHAQFEAKKGPVTLTTTTTTATIPAITPAAITPAATPPLDPELLLSPASQAGHNLSKRPATASDSESSEDEGAGQGQ